MEERRHNPRARVLKTAKIIHNRRSSVIDCAVRNLTPGGACLQVSSSLGVPDAFELSFEGGEPSRQARVVWRTDKKVGIAFD